LVFDILGRTQKAQQEVEMGKACSTLGVAFIHGFDKETRKKDPTNKTLT
jgi:hypothetical protein